MPVMMLQDDICKCKKKKTYSENFHHANLRFIFSKKG